MHRGIREDTTHERASRVARRNEIPCAKKPGDEDHWRCALLESGRHVAIASHYETNMERLEVEIRDLRKVVAEQHSALAVPVKTYLTIDITPDHEVVLRGECGRVLTPHRVTGLEYMGIPPEKK